MKIRTLTVWRLNAPGPVYVAEIVFEKVSEWKWIPLEADPELEWSLDKDPSAILRYLQGIKNLGSYHIEWAFNVSEQGRFQLDVYREEFEALECNRQKESRPSEIASTGGQSGTMQAAFAGERDGKDR